MDTLDPRPAARTNGGGRPNRPPRFPAIPTGWYYVCSGRDLTPGPVRAEVGDKSYVGFRDASGAAVTIGGRCVHMGADLGLGEVSGGRLRCPLHAWEFGGDGACARIPAADVIPPFARQPAFPTAEFGGHVAFHNAAAPRYPFPFYDGVAPADLLPAEPFDLVVRTPWHMIGANAFDAQHFRIAHDRELVGRPVVDSPHPLARRIAADYKVAGTSFRDRLTRRLSGSRVRMTVTVWAGTTILVMAAFRRTTSYGMVFVRPLDGARTHLRTIVWVPRRRGAVRRAALDPIDARVRRRFIRAFMLDDAARSAGVGYNPATSIDADQDLRDYFEWLAAATAGPEGSTP